MTAQIIDGKSIAADITDRITKAIADRDVKPGLAVIRIGDNEASRIYVNRKIKKCDELGFYSNKHELPVQTSESELLSLIEAYNMNDAIHGIIVQLPLPQQINPYTIHRAVVPEKDVDGFHPINLGNLMMGKPSIVAATPRGIMALVSSVHTSIAGMHAVVVGRSNTVGKPIAQLLLMQHATVTMCHSQTKDLATLTRMADILIVAIGKEKFITAEMVKPGATVIDVGINRSANGSVCGDVDFESVKEIAAYISPVPGGVGPMTIASLMQNTFEAYLKANTAT